MRRHGELIAFGVLCAGYLTGMSAKASWDFNHPKHWESPGDDPRVYSWGIVVFGMICAYIFPRMIAIERRHWRKRQVSFLLARTARLLRMGRLPEAEACLRECKRLAGYPNH